MRTFFNCEMALVLLASIAVLINRNSDYAILHSHGNSEDIGDIRPLLEGLKNHGFSVFAYGYRGYGTIGGKSSEHNKYQDVQTAYNYMVE